MSKKSPSLESEKIYKYLPNRWSPKDSEAHLSKENGILLHQQIDTYIKTKKFPEIMTYQFLQFYNFIYTEELEVLDSELKVEDEVYYGIIDALLIDKNNNVVLIDWKFSNYIDLIGYGFDKFFGLALCNYNRYSYQLHIYYYLISKMKIPINKIMIVNFSKNRPYEKFVLNINFLWLNSIHTRIFPKYTELIYKIPFGIKRNKTLKEIPSRYLNFLCASVIFNDSEGKLTIGDAYYYKVTGFINISKDLEYLVEHQKISINYSRQYADLKKFCMKCFINKTDDILCKICKPKVFY